MIKTDLVQIANIPYRKRKRNESLLSQEVLINKRNKMAKTYSDSVKKKNRIVSRFVSAFIGIILGLLLGFFHIQSVSAAGLTSEFSTQEWIDICYIARTVEAEAGNQSELGKRLVADTVLNRVNSKDYPNSVKLVVEQKNQYANGIVASTETIRLVMEEYRNPTNTEVLHFRTGHFHEWAIDLFQEGDHYFSK